MFPIAHEETGAEQAPSPGVGFRDDSRGQVGQKGVVMANSQNGYPVLRTNRTTGPLPRLRKWMLPGTDRHAYLRDGSAGFLLAHLALWFHENIENIGTDAWDDWGWAVRPVRGQTSGYSNHASGCAIDLNATRHPRGRATRSTFSQAEIDKIHTQLTAYDGVIRWGGDYTSTPDGMHFEINKPLASAQEVARRLWDSPLGWRVLAGNDGAASVIWDGQVPATTPAADTEAKVPHQRKKTAQGPRRCIDYSYARPHPAEVRAAGFRGVVRYLSGDRKKDLTKAEAAQLHRVGLWILLVWELSAHRAGEGRAAGIADARAAEAQADALGYPGTATILYAVDYDATPHQVREYFEGIQFCARRPVGIYGGVENGHAGRARHPA